ncbi:VPA1262 family N-terminal domain-containing protein [Mesorhizobium sp. B2-3-4]|uniref:VPA1262 family N-terminal domain-containing protein n=1 Tax=Mesorhizobium sp. B2-3-4 TaxID=2589959 RepID=UPI00112C8C0F|nr:VPA1262 family N-terminal domain-containing protein [Mesorhizobium sp. B2-3-4]TPM34695.1 hypothetical protein FJ967_21970 [Mesorhizobium sp. B2-3-4]
MIQVADDLYALATIRLAILRQDKLRDILFGMVELLPREMPKPVELGPSHVQLSGSQRRHLEFWHVVVSVTEALDWYARCARGDLATPRAAVQGGSPLSLQGGPFAGEPPWPHLAVGEPAPFLADWHGCVRSHRLVSLADSERLVRGIALAERDLARQACLSALHFDPFHDTDWLGDVILVAPNPLYRARFPRFVPQTQTGGERSLVRFEPRTGTSLEGLEVFSIERRGDAYGLIQRTTLTDKTFAVFEHPYPVGREGFAVICPQRGLLDIQQPSTYLKSVFTTFAARTSNHQVNVLAGRGRPEQTIRVDQLSEETQRIGQTPATGNPLVTLAVRREARRNREDGRRLGQRWFHGDQDEAAAFFQDLVGDARERVIFVDPYFGGHELGMFGHARLRPAVKLRVLTGAEFLRQASADYPGKEEGALVEEALGGFIDDAARDAVDIRVMPGNPPVLHDRFLVIDKAVWFSGNSFGDVGRRAGVVIRMPDPAPIIASIEEIWQTGATSFAKWIEARRKDSLPTSSAT